MWHFISADIGTQGTKVALVDEKGNIAASAFEPSVLLRGPAGTVEQDPEEMFGSVVRGIRQVVGQAGVPASRIAAIGLDGQMAGILGIDRDWNAVTPYDSWLDSRCGAYVPELRAWGEADIVRITGCPVTYAHGPKKLWWKKERPEVYRRIAKFVVPGAYVAGRLAGLKADQAYLDHTCLHFSGFADVSALQWSEPLTSAFGIDPGKLPRIASPWEIIGRLTAPYAAETGLPAGLPIVAGCGDTAAASLGAGLVRPGQLLDIAGTASVLSCGMAGYHPDTANRTLIYARSVLPDLWAPLAYINGGGECLAWFRRLIASDAAPVSFDDLNGLAAEVPAGSDGLLFVPHFGGRVCPNDTELKGGWLGLGWAHGRAAMYRAVLESIAYEYKLYLDALESLSGPVGYRGVHAVGGGAKGELFNRIKCDVLGIPYRTLDRQDSALVANAVVAGYGVGLFRDMAATAESFLSFADAFEPDPEAHLAYQPHVRSYRTALEGMSRLYRSLRA